MVKPRTNGVKHCGHMLAHISPVGTEDSQNIDWDAVEISDSGEPIEKRYHVILHYERIAKEESKFEAMHNTMMGNTVVENAKISIIEIDPDIEIGPLERSRY